MPKTFPRPPSAKAANEVHLAVDAATWTGVEARLRTDAPNEACCLIVTYPSTGNKRLTILLKTPIWPEPGEVDATPYSLELSADYVTRALDAAADAGPLAGLCLVHTHPETEVGPGQGRFSTRDDWYEERLFRTATLGKPNARFASIVLGSKPADLEARIYWLKGDTMVQQEAQALRVVGPQLTILETPASTWTDHPDPAVMDRSVRMLGKQGQRVLQNLRVGIVGLGGTGSITLQGLATMGVGNIQVWEKDRIKPHNRPRLLGAKSGDAGKPKITVLAAEARAAATANPFTLDEHPNWGTSAAGLQALRDCDVIFSCVDLFAARVPLSDLAYAHLIPVIDMGSKIYPADDRIEAILSTAQVWTPGLPCPWCNGTITQDRLQAEAQGTQRGIHRKAAYGLSLEATDGVEPSVLPINMTSAGLALLKFMQLVFHVAGRTPKALRLHLPAWELDESDLDVRPTCACLGDVAMGDAVRINPYLVPEDAEAGGVHLE